VLGLEGLVGDGVLVVLETIAVAGEDHDCHEGGEGRDEGANSGVGRCDLLSRGVRDWYR
jgi:hypothetical protein